MAHFRPRKDWHYKDCECKRCERDRSRGNRIQESGSRWTPGGGDNPDVGVIEDTDHVVSFKTDGDQTLIADGDYSRGDGTGAKEAREAFDGERGAKGHDDYGPKKEGGGFFGTRRGKYTGPDS